MCASIPAGSQAATRGKQVLVDGTRSGLCRTPAPVPDGSVVGGLVLVHWMWSMLTKSQRLQRSQTKGLASACTCSRCSPFWLTRRNFDPVRLTAALPATSLLLTVGLVPSLIPEPTNSARPKDIVRAGKGHSSGKRHSGSYAMGDRSKY